MRYRHRVGQREIELVSDDSVVAFRAGRTATGTLKRISGPHADRAVELTGHSLTLIHPKDASSRERVLDLVDGHRTARHHAAVFKAGGHHLVATQEVLLRFEPGADRRAVLRRAGATVVERLDALHVVEHPDASAFELASELASDGAVAWAEPHFLSVHHRPHLSSTHAPRASRRRAPKKGYELTLTKAWDAWDRQAGDPSTRIAVIDEGIQSTHPSLKGIVAGTYDATTGKPRQRPKPWDFHGTACAGLAAGTPRRGPIRGFGGGCGLLCVRMGYTADPDQSDLVTKTLWMARAIRWAWKSGASVLSCSWSAGAHSNAIVEAIGEARSKGRGRKGCVVVFAAGNLGDDVDYPASVPGVVTVAASNQFDEPKTGTSRDGERYWASNFGPEVDLAAPGVGIHTLDNQGRAGEGQGDFISDFNGTSSSTPMVAGVAGLVLSANPSLAESDVVDLLRASADKVGSVPYQKGRNDHMGWGRLNALNAVERALDS
jgi:subtilisin family serine protease